MPQAPRPTKKVEKIFFKIMGMPANLAHKPSKKEIYINKRLMYDETMKAR